MPSKRRIPHELPYPATHTELRRMFDVVVHAQVQNGHYYFVIKEDYQRFLQQDPIHYAVVPARR